MKKMACFPPTPKYEISLFKDLGTSATLQKNKKKSTVVYINNVSNVLVSDSYIIMVVSFKRGQCMNKTQAIDR